MPTFNHHVLRAWRLESGMTPKRSPTAPRSATRTCAASKTGAATRRAIVLARLAAVYGRDVGELFTSDPTRRVPGDRAAPGRRRQAAEQAAIDEWAREHVATWPPLSDRQRERLRVLFDLSDGGNGDGPA